MATATSSSKIVAVKREEIAAAQAKRAARSAARAMPRAARSRATSSARCARKIAAGAAGGDRRDQEGEPEQGRAARATSIRPTIAAELRSAHGAACLSVLTDRQFFQGAPRLPRSRRAPRARCRCCARTSSSTRTRSYESRAMGADCDPADRRRASTTRRCASSRRSRAASAWRCWSRCTTRAELERALRLRDAADRHQQPQPAHLRGVAATRRSGCWRDVPADRLVVTESGILAQRRRRADARGRRARLPRRRGVHARARPGRGAGAALFRVTGGRLCAAGAPATLPSGAGPLVLPGWSAAAAGWRWLAGRGRAAVSGRAADRPADPFRALRLVAPEAVKVVVLGQDPYPTPARPRGWRSRPAGASRARCARSSRCWATAPAGIRRARTLELDALGAAGRAAAQPGADRRGRTRRQPSWTAAGGADVARSSSCWPTRPSRRCSCCGRAGPGLLRPARWPQGAAAAGAADASSVVRLQARVHGRRTAISAPRPTSSTGGPASTPSSGSAAHVAIVRGSPEGCPSG